jgi:hypothetical protein
LSQDDLLRTHHGEESADAHGQAFLHEGVVDPIGIPAFENQAGILEDAEMAGYRRSADREPGTDLTRRELAPLEVLEDLTPRRVGEGAENSGVVIHTSILAILLISINPQSDNPARSPLRRICFCDDWAIGVP